MLFYVFKCESFCSLTPLLSAACLTSFQNCSTGSNWVQSDSTHQFLWSAERSADLHYVFMFLLRAPRWKYSNAASVGSSVIDRSVCMIVSVCVCECSPPAHCGADHKANCDEVLIKMDMWTDPVALSGIRTGLVNTRLIRQTTLESNSWMRSSSAARRGQKTFTYLFCSKLPRTNTQI